MTDQPSTLAIVVFFLFVGATLGLSFFLGRQAKSSKGYFAAHGQIPWFVNGIAFAGDYLSAASFLGICGMIAFYGYDGFLYSIGYLAGWIVALFVVAEPMKRLGKFTFADALDSRFGSRGIRLAAGISTPRNRATPSAPPRTLAATSKHLQKNRRARATIGTAAIPQSWVARRAAPQRRHR